jgi:cytochrome P450
MSQNVFTGAPGETAGTYLICRARDAARIATLDIQPPWLDRPKMALPVLDLKAPAFWQDPAAVLAVLREESPMALSHEGTKVLLRHADVERMLLTGKFENEGATLLARRGFKPGDALYDFRRKALGALNGPDHVRIRTLAGKALGPRYVEYVRGAVERRLPGILAPHLDQVCEAIPAVTARLPLEVIGEYLGIDEADRSRVDGLVREGQARAFGLEVTPEIVARANEIFAELIAFVGDQVRERRMRPRNDALANLLAAEDEGRKLSQDEVIVLFLNLFIGAVESTASSMASGLLLLSRHPGVLEVLRQDPQSVNAFVEENLRLFPPNTLIANKVAKEDLSFCGVPFARGEGVIVATPAPNRDPRAFANPDLLDLKRPPTRHFTFSLGQHFCLGQALARAQLQAFFSVISRMVSRVDLCQDGVKWVPYAAITSMESLRLRFSSIDPHR